MTPDHQNSGRRIKELVHSKVREGRGLEIDLADIESLLPDPAAIAELIAAAKAVSLSSGVNHSYAGNVLVDPKAIKHLRTALERIEGTDGK